LNTQTISEEVVRMARLANGLTILAQPMPWLRTAAFALAVRGGVECEPDGRGGLAGLMCEMVQRGAGPYSSRDVVELQDNLGLDHSAGVSAALASFGAAMPGQSLADALRLYAEIVRRPHLPGDQLDDARMGAMHEVRAVQDEPTQQVILRLKRMQYGERDGRPNCGDEPGLTAITMSDLHDFYAKRYRPDGAILAVAGNFDVDEIIALAESLFGDWQGELLEIPQDQSGQPGYEHIQQDSSQTHIGLSFDSIPLSDPDYYLMRAGVGILSDGMSSRLFDRVREQRGLCYTVSVSAHSLQKRGSVMGYAGTTPERAQETLDVTLREIETLQDGIEPDELERLKVRVQSSVIMEQESSWSRVSSLISDWYHRGRVVTMRELEERIEALRIDDIVAYWKAHPPGGYRVVTLGQQPLTMPASRNGSP
jgi:predicted Zn-dependent peptidase